MMRRILLFMLLLQQGVCFSQYKTDKKLEGALRPLVDSFHGVAGVYVLNLKTGRVVAINADTVFPTASIIKIPILVGIEAKIHAGVYRADQSMLYRDSMAKGGSGLMQFFKDSTMTDLRTVMTLMITHSDNSAGCECGCE
jgi:beta-lactamase class A